MLENTKGPARLGARPMPAFPASRLAVCGMFLLNGIVVGSWAPKIPEFAGRLDLSEAGLGLMIFGFGVGSLVFMPAFGAWVARAGSRTPSRFGCILVTLVIPAITLAPNTTSAAIVLFLVGGAVGGTDIAMNASAVSVERKMGRAIMSSCHGFWSIGGLIGAAAGGPLIAAFGTLGHALIVALICLIILAMAWTSIVVDRPETAISQKTPLRLPRASLPYALGIVALFSMIPEGAVLDWGALYMREELGADLVLSGWGFAAFSATMAIMRFMGDRIRNRLGAVQTLRVSAFLAALGLLTAGQAPNSMVAIIGFAIAGIGVANMVPIVFSAAGNMPGIATGIGLSIVTFMGYSGVLFAPSIIGFIAEYTGFSPIFTALPALFIIVLALSGLTRSADINQ